MIVGGGALFVVMSGFSGLKAYGVSLSSVFDPDLKILPQQGKYLFFSDEDLQKIKKIQGVEAVSKTVEERVFLSYDKKNYIGHIKGVDGNYLIVNHLDSVVEIGHWMLEEHRVVVGAGIKGILGLSLYDYDTPLHVIVPKPGSGSILKESKPYRERLKVVSGVYKLTDELNRKYVFTSLEEAQDLLGLKPDEISGVELRVYPSQDVERVRSVILKTLNNSVQVKTRQELNDAFYRMLNTENIATYLIFTLVLVVALFNLAGALIMIIVDKKTHLRVLYVMGFSLRQLQLIFFLQGVLMSVLGALIGVFFAGVLIVFQQYFQWVKITEDLAYPVELRLENVIIVILTIVFLGSFASWIASKKVQKKLLSR